MQAKLNGDFWMAAKQKGCLKSNFRVSSVLGQFDQLRCISGTPGRESSLHSSMRRAGMRKSFAATASESR